MKNTLNISHKCLHFLYQAIAAITYAFGTYTMLSRGYTSSECGVLIACGDVVGFLVQFFVSNYLDNSKKANIFQVSSIMATILLLVYVINYVLIQPCLLLSIAYVLLLSLFNSLCPLINSFSKLLGEVGIKIDFSMARAFGSLSFGITCIGFGFITEKFGYRYVNASMIGLGILLLCTFVLLAFIVKSTNSNEIKEGKEETISFKDFFIRHKLYLFVCIGMTCVSCGFSITENFMLPIIQDIGGTSLDSGIIQGIKAIFEVPVMYNYKKIEERFGIYNIMIVACLSHVVKAVILVISNSLWPVYASQLLQCTSYALLLPASVSYVDTIMDKREIVRGHSLSSIASTVIGVVCNTIGGFAIDNYGTKSMCAISTLITIIGTILIVIFMKKDMKNSGKFS